MRTTIAALFVLMATTAAIAGPGPLDALYLTAGDQSTNLIVQGTSATTFAQAGNLNGSGDEYAIAVGSTVRTLSNGNQGTGSNPGPYGVGAEYTLGGTFTGNTYVYPNVGYFYDGTRDASHNYSADFITGNIYQFGLDWTSPTLLFNSNLNSSLGITYDSKDNTLWIAAYKGSSRRYLHHFVRG